MTEESVRIRTTTRHFRQRGVVLAALVVGSMAGASAHIVRGVQHPTLATAFVSSPSSGQDSPVRIVWGNYDSGHRVVCFYVANTSVARVDDDEFPRIATVEFELPGTLSGFSLVEPLDRGWELVEGRTEAISGYGAVVLDVSLVARGHRAEPRRRRHDPVGIPPGQDATRGSGTRFCVSGPFPDTLPNRSDPGQPIPTTIEQLINGVVVGFTGVQRFGPGADDGVWDSLQRAIPLYSE